MFKVPKPEKFQPDHERFIYEPRALWSVANVISQLETTKVLPTSHFKNASKYPLRLTHILVSPINYLLRSYSNVAPSSTAQYDVSGSIINRCTLRIDAPYSYAFQNVLKLGMQEFAAEPTGEPAPPKHELSSGLLGITRWDFDIDYVIPAKGMVQFDMSTVTPPLSSNYALPKTSMLFTEGGGNEFGGHARYRDRAAVAWAASQGPGPGQVLAYPQVPAPLPQDAVGQAVPGGNTEVWLPGQMFGGTDFAKQNAARGVSKVPLKGFAVHIDQREYDDDMNTSLTYGAYPVTPISQRIITRARTQAGGTYEAWWRDGAPLALVSPTITPALVKELEEPIWLQPNELLRVEVGVPAPVTIAGVGLLAPIYNVGVSLVGQAVVEIR